MASNVVAEIAGAARFLRSTASSRGKLEIGTPNRRRYTKVYLSQAHLSSKRLKRPAWKRRVASAKRGRKGAGRSVGGKRGGGYTSVQTRKRGDSRMSSRLGARVSRTRTRKKGEKAGFRRKQRVAVTAATAAAAAAAAAAAPGGGGTDTSGRSTRARQQQGRPRSGHDDRVDDRPPEFDHGTFYYPGASSTVQMRYGAAKGGGSGADGTGSDAHAPTRGNASDEEGQARGEEEQDEEHEKYAGFGRSRGYPRRRRRSNQRRQVSVHDASARLESLLDAFNAAVRTSHQGTGAAPLVIPISMPMPVPMFPGAAAAGSAPAAVAPTPAPASVPTPAHITSAAEEAREAAVSAVARASEEAEKRMLAMADSTVRLSKAASIASEALESIPAVLGKAVELSKSSARSQGGAGDGGGGGDRGAGKVESHKEGDPGLTLTAVSAIVSSAMSELERSLEERFLGRRGDEEKEEVVEGKTDKGEVEKELVEGRGELKVDEQTAVAVGGGAVGNVQEEGERKDEEKEQTPGSTEEKMGWAPLPQLQPSTVKIPPASLQVAAKGGPTPSAQISVDIASIVKDVIVELSPRMRAAEALIETPKMSVPSKVVEEGRGESGLLHDGEEKGEEEEVAAAAPSSTQSPFSAAPLDEARISQIIAEQLELAEEKRQAREQKVGKEQGRRRRRLPRRNVLKEGAGDEREEGEDEEKGGAEEEEEEEEEEEDRYTLKQLKEVRNFLNEGRPSAIGNSNYATPSTARANARTGHGRGGMPRQKSFHWASLERRGEEEGGDEKKKSKLLAVAEVKEMLRRLEEDDSERREHAALIDRQVFQLLLHLEKRQKKGGGNKGAAGATEQGKRTKQSSKAKSKAIARKPRQKAKVKARIVEPLLGKRSLKVNRRGSVAVEIEGERGLERATPRKLDLGRGQGSAARRDESATAPPQQELQRASTMFNFPLPERDPLPPQTMNLKSTLPGVRTAGDKENELNAGASYETSRTPKWLKPLSRMSVTGGESVQSTSRFANDVRMVSDAFKGQMWSPKL